MKKLEKIEKVEPPKTPADGAVRLPPRAALRRRRGQAQKVHKGYGGRVIYDGLDFLVRRRERWCVMGVNGAGKSTLLKLVAGAT